MCGNEQVVIKCANVQDVSFFIKTKRSSCSFNMAKLTVKEQWCLIGMFHEGIRINDDIHPNWANDVCK